MKIRLACKDCGFIGHHCTCKEAVYEEAFVQASPVQKSPPALSKAASVHTNVLTAVHTVNTSRVHTSKMCSFRLTEEVIDKLEFIAKQRGLSKTAVLEQLVLGL